MSLSVRIGKRTGTTLMVGRQLAARTVSINTERFIYFSWNYGNTLSIVPWCRSVGLGMLLFVCNAHRHHDASHVHGAGTWKRAAASNWNLIKLLDLIIYCYDYDDMSSLMSRGAAAEELNHIHCRYLYRIGFAFFYRLNRSHFFVRIVICNWFDIPYTVA